MALLPEGSGFGLLRDMTRVRSTLSSWLAVMVLVMATVIMLMR